MKKRNKIKLGFKVLCLDPSLTAFGYSVVMGENTVLEGGCIKTAPTDKKLRIRKGDDRMRRVSEINKVLLAIIAEYDIKYIVSELPHGSQSALAATALGMVSALVQTLADSLDITVEWYSEADSKKAIGVKSGNKNDMIEAISRKYKFNWAGVKYKDEAVADSLAIHNVAYIYSAVLKIMK